jgi:AraC-like DNA-binding protein
VAAQAGLRLTPPSPAMDARHGRLPLVSLVRLLQQTDSVDPNLGLLLGQRLQPASFAVTGHLVMACPTLLLALPLIERYQDLVMDCVRMRHDVSQGQVSLNWQLDDIEDPLSRRHCIDLLMAAMRQFGIWLTGITEPFSQTRFSYPRPRDCGMHAALFGDNLCFGCRDNGFSFPLEWAMRPIRSADQSLVPVLELHAARLLSQLCSDRLIAAVSQLLLEGMARGETGIAHVAARLHTSPRALQRHLKSQGTTYAELLQHLRLDLANLYLADPHFSLGEVARRLGYSEQSSFSHAYRQWAGLSPQTAREALINHRQGDAAPSPDAGKVVPVLR